MIAELHATCFFFRRCFRGACAVVTIMTDFLLKCMVVDASILLDMCFSAAHDAWSIACLWSRFIVGDVWVSVELLRLCQSFDKCVFSEVGHFSPRGGVAWRISVSFKWFVLKAMDKRLCWLLLLWTMNVHLVHFRFTRKNFVTRVFRLCLEGFHGCGTVGITLHVGFERGFS